MATDINLIKQTAHDYIARGFQIIPLHGMTAEGACTCSKGVKCPSAGKHPVWKNWPNEQLADDLVDGYFTNNPDYNLGIKTGTCSGIFVLDIDPDHGGMDSLRKLIAKHKKPSKTLMVLTGSKGLHYYFNMPDFAMRNSAGKLGSGIDIRTDGGQVVAPPSKTKHSYLIPEGCDRPIVDAPDWLLELLRPKEAPEPKPYQPDTLPPTPLEDVDDAEMDRFVRYANAAADKEANRLNECTAKSTPKGQKYRGPQWNQTTFEVACNLIQLANSDWNDLTLPAVKSMLFDYAPRDEEFDNPQIRTCWDSAIITVGDSTRDRPAQIIDLFEGRFQDEDNTPAAPKPAEPVGVEGDTRDVEEWVAEALKSGTPQQFWRVVGEIATGTNTDAPLVVFRGGAPLLGTLSRELLADVGDSQEVLLFGPRVTTRDQAGDRTVFDFAPIPVPEFDLQAMLSLGIDTLEQPIRLTELSEEDDDDAADVRSGRQLRTRRGAGTFGREEDDVEEEL